MNNYTQLKARIQQYLDKYPLLSRTENINKFKRLRYLEKIPVKTISEKNEMQLIRDELIVSNGGFGMKYAIIYCKKINDPAAIDDIFQESQLGIIESVNRFNPDLGYNFTTFAYHYVRKNIIDYISNHSKIVSAPRDMARNIKHVNAAYSTLWTKSNGGPISTANIQEYLKKTRDLELNTSVIDEILQLIELNSPNDDSFTNNYIDDICNKNDNQTLLILFKSIILNSLKSLDPVILDIVKMRFGIDYDRPYSLEEIMMIKKYTSEQIEQSKDITRVFR